MWLQAWSARAAEIRSQPETVAIAKTRIALNRRIDRFFGRVRNGYMVIARREPLRVAVVDARGTPSQTHAKILEVVRTKLRLPAKAQ